MFNTNIRVKKCINSIAVTPNLKKHIEGRILFETNEISNTDDRLHVIDVNLEAYFQEEFSTWDKFEKGFLDLNKRTHR